MLDAMRRGVANVFTKILLGLLIVAFAVWGIGDYIVRGPSQGGALATVGSKEITVDDYRRAYRDEVQLIAGKLKLGQTLTPEQAKLLGVPPRALARLIGIAAIDLHAGSLGVTVSDDIIRNIVRGDPAFQGADGKFSPTKFRSTYLQQGYRGEAEYIDARRRDLWREQLTEALGAGVVPPEHLVDVLHRFRDETRVIEYFTSDFSKQIAIADPPESQLKEFFEQNKGKYVALEERKAGLLLLTRDEALKRANVTDEEVKAAYEAAKDSYDTQEKRRVSQLTFSDKAAAEKAYAALAKAKNFEEAAGKLGFPAADIQLGLLTRADMIDPKIADAAFKLKLNEVSRPVEGQFSVVLLRVTEIEAAKKRTFEEVKGEIRERVATERVGQQVQAIYEKVEVGRAKGAPLKEIAAETKLPFQEIGAINRTRKTADGKAPIAHADAAKITDAIFEATPGVETDALELGDGGFAWFDLRGVTPERRRSFDEVATEVRADFMASERTKQMASLAAKQIERLKGGEKLAAVAKSFGAKVERTQPIKRGATPPPAGLTAVAVQQAFALPKGGAASAPTADGKSRAIFRVADVIAAPDATAVETAALKAAVANQLRVDLVEQYVGALRTRYGVNVNEKVLIQALGLQPGPEAEN